MNCIICGKEIEKSSYMNKVLCSSECFTTDYWNEIIAEKDNHIIIEGVCYYDAGKPNNDIFIGHSGRKFHIKLHDGTVITTNNLWMQGSIPERFRNDLPDNAEFC